MLNRNMFQPRMNWRFCHELAHILLDHSKAKTITYEMEQEAERLAGELMLPADDFRLLMGELELSQLRMHYPHASWEAIARKYAELRPAVLTIFDNDRLTYRKGPEGFTFPPRPTPPEMEIVRQCHDDRNHTSTQTDNLIINGYFVDEGQGVERVLLLTETIDYF